MNISTKNDKKISNRPPICFLEKKPEYHLVYKSGKPLELVNWFLTALKTRGLSDMTIRAYAYDLLVFHRWWLTRRHKTIKNINTWDLQNWIEFQRENGAKPASINRRLSSFESYYRFCFGKAIHKSNRVAYPSKFYRGSKFRVKGLFVRRNLLDRKLRVKAPKPIINSLEIDEINRFLGTLRKYRDKSIVLLMLFCGLRLSEVLNLRFDSVDFEKARVRIWGKGGKERILPLSEKLIFVMKKYLLLERPEISKAETFFVVLHGTSRGEPMTIAGLRTVFRHWRMRTGIQKAHPHNFRHAFGTNMARSGVSLPVLQKMMGHTEFKHTLRYINLAMTDVAEEYTKALTKIEERYEKADIA